MSAPGSYYADKLETLRDLFGTADVVLEPGSLTVSGRRCPIVDDVIVLLEEPAGGSPAFAADIRDTFGAEWTAFDRVLPEHAREFEDYFDLVPLESLEHARVADLGCGMGRWSWFLRDRCRELVLVDFSDAIHVARRTLAGCPRALFFRADLERLPFRADAFDFAFSLGVLHHLPSDALDAVRALGRLSPRLLVYLYYALDNRPVYYRWLLGAVTAARSVLWKVRSSRLRGAFTVLVALAVYRPLVTLGVLAARVGLGRHVPLYEFYHGTSLARIRQDVYDRFFTRIEQRVSRKQIAALADTFRAVTVSGRTPYWHFRCDR